MRVMLLTLAFLLAAWGVDGQVGTPVRDTVPESAEARTGKWDVTQPLGPSKTLSFETSEGTWLNVDVSPDGGTLVFDLLGDLYTLPVAGGRATRLTSGAQFDFQPRFSPDGRSIAFISDRDGVQNIWLMDADGGNPRQVSRETEREVNSPAWSPDGEYIFARKHFVETRSLGAGEVWMYHRSGGAGLQVTERPNWQQDQGEPAPHPDGRWLHYSQDVTPGPTFQYNKDPYRGIYAILRRDLVTGETQRVTGGPGGAITPGFSPDGRLMSFIKRDRLNTVLYLRDLETGQERPLWDGLDRDMQEIWAIHGVYTQYAWLPDGRAIVIWAQGGFWRVDVETGAATRIPFTAQVEQTVHEGLRYAVDVAPPEFRARMIRNVTTSPAGDRVAYDALGKIWLVRPGVGAPARLTATGYDAGFESHPAFSPDGRRVAYVTWSDADRGRVRVVGVDGRGARTVVTAPGHYVEPAWSPDGRWIVYRSVGGDGIRGQTFGENRGIFVVPADGSAPPRKVRDGGTEPRFDHTGARIYVLTGGGPGRRLVSTDLHGGDEVVHLESANATQIVPSPDGRWVAFAERYHAYLMPFPQAGRTVRLGPEVRAYPVARISRDAGMYLHWSSSSTSSSTSTSRSTSRSTSTTASTSRSTSTTASTSRSTSTSGAGWSVHWALGPEYYTRDLAASFAWLADGDGEGEGAAEQEAAGVDISFMAAADAPEGVIALTGARIITMAGQGWSPPGGWQPEAESHEPRLADTGTPTVIEDGTLVVRGNRIEAVGPAGDVAVPAGARVVDVTGRTIIPGLIDVHAHVGTESNGLLAQASWPLLANLAYGVTTAHDPSANTEMIFSNAELLRAGVKLGPRLYSTGTILYGAETPFRTIVNNYEDALSHLRRMQAVGAISVKSYNQRRRDVRQMFVKAARELGMMVVPEGGALLYSNMTMVHDGHTGLEHALSVPVVYEDVRRLFAESTTGYTPTVLVAYGGIWGENWFYQHYDVWENERLLTFTPRPTVDALSRRRMLIHEDDFNHIEVAEGARAIAEAGGLINLGAHGQLQGLGAHWEMWTFVQGGMSPLEALAVGTINGAQYLGMERDLGTLEPGKLADLVVLDANPLDDITNSDSVRYVMLNGRLYDAATLNELAPRERTRPLLPWER
jgi:imidazolonepropionase-like amidohydrolase/Tol biopolymer transport system component